MNPREIRAARIREQQQILDGARAAGRDLTAEENARFNTLQREINELTLQITQQEAARQEEQGEAQTRQQDAQAAGTDPQEAQRAVEAERQRVAEVTSLCRDFGENPENYIREGMTTDQVRAAILENLRSTSGPVNITVTRDEQETFRRRASDALLMRAGVSVQDPADGAGELRGMTLRDLGIDCLSREGKNTGELLRMSPEQLYGELCREFYNPTAAFPAIMDQTIRKSIVQMYNHVPTTFEAITTKGSLKDFKETPDHEYLMGGLGEFKEVAENGEIKPDIPKTTLLPTRKLKSYARQFSMTRQAFINDDIGFLAQIPGLYAAAAKRTIDKQVLETLYNNAVIFDGKPLFHTSHKNLVQVGSKPSQASIQEIILLMQRQTDPFGDPIYINPAKIVVGVGYEFDLAVILHSTQVTGSANNDINPLYNYPLQIVQSPVLTSLAGNNACPWFMISDNASARGIQVDYLNGQETPNIRRMEVPGTLGFVWDIYLDWGVNVRDWRGIAKNPGVAVGQ